MDFVANVSDCMLILAVGIMLALIVHWQVDIFTSGGDMSDSGMTVAAEMNGQGGNEYVNESEAQSFTEDQLQSVDPSEATSGEGMEELGTVYYDAETGTYYVVENNTASSDTSGDTSSQTGD